MISWIRRNLFPNWWQATLTLLGGWIVWASAVPLVRWALLEARFTGGPDACMRASGACWAFVVDSLPLFLFGTYPEAERWRAVVWLGIVAAVALVSLVPGLRRSRAFAAIAVAAVVLGLVLLHGSETLGLRVVATSAWGGLLLTVLLSTVGILASFPLGVVLALGRQSRRMPGVRMLCVAIIEPIRAVPLVSILFLAAVLVPLFFPDGVQVDNLVRAQIGIIVFQSAYMAEVVRGGLQAVPSGQEDAAMALGLSYVQRMRCVVLPQALRMVVPALVNQLIIIIKDTSLVVVVGMFDLLGAAELAVRNVAWAGRNFEAYAFVGLIYWTICYGISRLSLRVERRIADASGG